MPIKMTGDNRHGIVGVRPQFDQIAEAKPAAPVPLED